MKSGNNLQLIVIDSVKNNPGSKFQGSNYSLPHWKKTVPFAHGNFRSENSAQNFRKPCLNVLTVATHPHWSDNLDCKFKTVTSTRNKKAKNIARLTRVTNSKLKSNCRREVACVGNFVSVSRSVQLMSYLRDGRSRTYHLY